jgi:hypothetical protein
MRPLADKEPHAPGKGCYYVTNVHRSGSYVQRQTAGDTEWTIESGKLKFALFRSQDAGYFVELEMNHAGNEVRGVGRSEGAGLVDPGAGPDLIAGYQSSFPDRSNCNAQNQVSATLAEKQKFIPYSPLNETEAESLKARLEGWGFKDVKREELMQDEFHNHTYREPDVVKAYPELRGRQMLSECANSMMGGAARLVFLASQGKNEATLDTLRCSGTRRGLNCRGPERGHYYVLDSSDHYFTLEGLTFPAAKTILETYAAGRVIGLPEWVNPKAMNITAIKALFDNRYRMVFGEFFCAGCSSRFDVDLETKDGVNRLVVVGKPQGGCI